MIVLVLPKQRMRGEMRSLSSLFFFCLELGTPINICEFEFISNAV